MLERRPRSAQTRRRLIPIEIKNTSRNSRFPVARKRFGPSRCPSRRNRNLRKIQLMRASRTCQNHSCLEFLPADCQRLPTNSGDVVRQVQSNCNILRLAKEHCFSPSHRGDVDTTEERRRGQHITEGTRVLSKSLPAKRRNNNPLIHHAFGLNSRETIVPGDGCETPPGSELHLGIIERQRGEILRYDVREDRWRHTCNEETAKRGQQLLDFDGNLQSILACSYCVCTARSFPFKRLTAFPATPRPKDRPTGKFNLGKCITGES